MRKLLAICIFLQGAWCNTGSAQWVSSDVNPKSVGTIYVLLEDNAKGGCWTNLREVREYAEEKLRIAGYSTAAKDKIYEARLFVDVLAYKSNGQCLGAIRAALIKLNSLEGVFGYHDSGYHLLLTNMKQIKVRIM